MKRKIFIGLVICIFLSTGVLLGAKEYKAAIVDLPTTPMYVALTKAIGEETNNTFSIEVVPIARAIYLVENKQVDISGPAVSNPSNAKQSSLNYDFATTSIVQLPYILYTKKDKKISIEDLKKGNPQKFKIEANANLALILEFNVDVTTNIEASIQKVANGSIDGFIESQASGDSVLKKHNLTNIKRELYSKFDVIFRLPKGSKGGEADKVITDGITKLKANGKYNTIIEGLIKQSTFIDWQP